MYSLYKVFLDGHMEPDSLILHSQISNIMVKPKTCGELRTYQFCNILMMTRICSPDPGPTTDWTLYMYTLCALLT